MKKCLWCKEPIPKGRMCPSQYNAISCHAGSCAANYRWHKCSEDELEELPDRFCPHCNEKLVRREGETSQAWRKRVFCNKSHKGFYSTKVVKWEVNHEQEAIKKAGIKIYVPGSEEFNRVAALYGGAM